MKGFDPPISFLLGLPFHRTTMAETLQDCERAMESGEPSYVVTANADFVAQAYKDPDLHQIVFFARRVVCDGMPLVWLSRVFNISLPERIAGSDLVFHLFERCAKKEKRVFFLGSDEATLGKVTEKLTRRYPGLQIAGQISPPVAPVHEWPNDAIIKELHATRPDLLLVAVGCPKQERWIYQNYRRAKVPLAIGIGASLDFISGKQVRSPKWMQKTGLEWVWRMMTDPRRLAKRYFTDFKYLLLLAFRQANVVFRKRRRFLRAESASLKAPALPSVAGGQGIESLVWSGELQKDELHEFEIPEKPDKAILCNLSAVRFIDSSGIGSLVKLARNCRAASVPCAFHAPAGHPFEELVKGLKLETVLPSFATEEAARAWLVDRMRRQQSGPDVLGSPERVHLTGELDMHTIGPIEEQLATLTEALPEGRCLELDCAELRFLDSYAIGQIIAARKAALSQGKDLALVDPSVEVIQVLNLLHLAEFLIKR